MDMEEVNDKFLEAVAQAATVEDILDAGEACGVEVTEEEARAYFELQERAEGALSDEALDEVAGGGSPGIRLKSHWYCCNLFRPVDAQPGKRCCKRCKKMVILGSDRYCTAYRYD